jgi:hypothetical protein
VFGRLDVSCDPPGSDVHAVTIDSNGPEPPLISPSACALFEAGHQVHIVQAKRSWEADRASYRTGVVLEVEDDGWLTAEFDGETVRLWNHQPQRLGRAVQDAGPWVGLTRYSLLHVPHTGGSYCFSVTGGPSACKGPPPADADPVERIRTHGGFLLPGREVRRLLGRAA